MTQVQLESGKVMPSRITFLDARTRFECLLTEDERGWKLLRRIGMTWLYYGRPSPDQVADILAATGED